MNKYDFYPWNDENLVLSKDNKAVWKHPRFGHLCGYVALRKEQIPEEWWGNYYADALQYLNIHGGITYCEVEGNYVVFGFDCAHLDDDKLPALQNPEFVMKLTEQMEQQLLEYAKRIKEWRQSDRKRRIEIIDEIRNTAEIKMDLGFGAILDMLVGGEAFGEVKNND